MHVHAAKSRPQKQPRLKKRSSAQSTKFLGCFGEARRGCFLPGAGSGPWPVAFSLDDATLDRLDPKTLGALLAFYEHRTVIQAWLAGINPFDQWGVELGKQLANSILQEWAHPEAESKHDSSTEMLITQFKNWIK